jgi:hypothetical protein
MRKYYTSLHIVSDTNTLDCILELQCQRNKESNIEFSWQNASGKVVVTTTDERSFEADHVIVTVS